MGRTPGEESTTPKTKPPYREAFRSEAVVLARSSAKPVPRLAQELGVSDQTLRNWLHQGDVDAGRGRPGELTTAEREELPRLRREVKTLHLWREILKNAAALFAKETL